MRLAVYTGYAYNRDPSGRLFATRAFALFVVRVAEHADRVVLAGSVRPEGTEIEEAHYPIPAGMPLVELPYYESLAHPAAALSLRSLRRFWRALDDVDGAWIFGPHPIAIAFALIAAARRRGVVLGVRQDNVAYVRARHPHRRLLHVATSLLERAFGLLCRRFPTVAVGPELARRYVGTPRLLEVAVSLVEKSDLVPPERALARSYDGELRVLSVGRLEAEKNPGLLADVLAILNRDGARWRLVVCGEGELRDELAQRLRAAGQDDRADLLGYVRFGDELTARYRDSHVLLHNSLTEGLPQVLLEAMAAGLPVVASDVGGIRAALGPAVSLVPPGDPAAAAQALESVASDPQLRRRLVEAGHAYVASRTIDDEATRVAAFLEEAIA